MSATAFQRKRREQAASKAPAPSLTPTVPDKPLEKWSTAQLKTKAAELGLNIDGAAKKADILAAILAHLEEGVPDEIPEEDEIPRFSLRSGEVESILTEDDPDEE